MATLLIVDDERHITDRLSGFIPWDESGVTKVHKAYSAEEALDVMESCSVDIVLTDIRMPGISGLELSEQIRRRWRKTKCILLSGHAEFEYAKEAIRHGAVSYLLKPVKDEELLAAVGQVRMELEEEWRAILSQERIAQAVRENLPQMKGNLLGELLLGRRYTAAELRDKLAMLSIFDFYEKPFALMLVRLDQPFHTYDPQSLALVEYAVGNIAEELFLPDYGLWHGKDVHGYLVFLIRDLASDGSRSSEYHGALESKAGQLKEAIHTYLRGSATILISRAGQFPADLAFTYGATLSALRRRIGDTQDLILTVTDGVSAEGEQSSLCSLYELPSLVHLLEAGQWLQARERLHSIAAELQSEEHLLEAYFAIASAASSFAHKNGKQLADLIGFGYEKLAVGMPFRNVQQLLNWSLELLDRLRREAETDKQDSRSKLIADVQHFVEKHLDKDVSLTAISKHVYLHPVYISKIYKLETGENISDYVYRLRMEKAVRLLLDTTDKIYEIATCLGYQRAHSFIHVFKKHTGLTPQEYRDQYGLLNS